MNPASGMSWPDLHYADTERVELDVHAIIARGLRLRRRRLVTKVAAAAVVVSIAPVAVVVEIGGSVQPARTEAVPGAPHQRLGIRNPPAAATSGPIEVTHGLAADAHVKAPAVFGPATEPEAGQVVTAFRDSSIAGDELMFSLARAGVRRATTLSRPYGPLLAVAGARASSGIWFTATAAQLTLFHLSMAGALRSWPLPTPASSVLASAGVGLAVTSAGLAWVGVGSTLMSLDTKNAQVSTWQIPARRPSEAGDPGAGHSHQRAWPGNSRADSVAVSPDGHVAVATSHSGSVQVLDPRNGTFHPVNLPHAGDQPLAVGYARDGTLGIGYRRLSVPHTGAVLLVSPTGRERSTPVAQPTALSAYGASALLVGVTKLAVVSAHSRQRPLLMPVDSPDFAGVVTPPAPLPGDRLGIAMSTAILTFPAAATSTTIAANQSELWVTQAPRCRPHHACPAGYQLMATDEAGDMWLVPKADPRTVELVSLR